MTTFPSGVRGGLRLVLPAMTLAALWPGLATARADAIEDAFLAAVQSKGINFGSPENAIIAAREICDQLDLGKTPADIGDEVMTNSNLDAFHAGYFIGVSIRAFCPHHGS